jgi:hypothetical protein
MVFARQFWRIWQISINTLCTLMGINFTVITSKGSCDFEAACKIDFKL